MGDAPVRRGCGIRVEGGIYIEVPLSRFGVPLENFMFCEPVTHVENNRGVRAPIAEAWGLSPRGVTLVTLEGRVHVVDIVGSGNADGYYNAADILEETRRHGLSRRLELTEANYELLGPGSNVMLAHARGHKTNASDYALAEPLGPRPCPKHHKRHQRNHLTGMCACLHYEGLEHGHVIDGDGRLVKRTVGDTSYTGYYPPEGVSSDRHEMALIAAFPIRNLAVVKHPDESTTQDALARAGRTAFEVSLDDF